MDLLERINSAIQEQGERIGNELMWQNKHGIEICFKQEIVSRLDAQIVGNTREASEVKYLEAKVIANFPVPGSELFWLQLSSPQTVRVMQFNVSFKEAIEYLSNLPDSYLS